MRTPADLPSRRRTGSLPRGRVVLVGAAVLLVVLGTSLRGIAGFWTDLLWFDSLGFGSVFTGVLGAKVSLALLAMAAFFVLLWLNLFIADRLAPRFRPVGPEEEVIERYQQLIGNRSWLVRLVVSALFAFVAGAGVSGQWREWLLFTNARDFDVLDAQFKTDVGFYVFKLPFLTFLVDWAFASVIVMLLVTGVAHYLNGGIRVQVVGQRVSPQVKAHLSVLLGVLALLKAAGYWLDRYELAFSRRGAVDGATYTDVKAQLPAIRLLLFISLVAFALLIVNIWRRGWVLPVLAVGLWAFIAIVVGGIVPAFVQRFQVTPSESAKERPYIVNNIEATRTALGLDEVTEKPFAADDGLDAAGLAANATTVGNIRLWDPETLERSYQKLQESKSYYQITDVDVDRYEVDGQLTQVMISARNLKTSGVPQASWQARHLTYTHGYGVVAAPSNAKTTEGGPDLLVRDVPVVSTEPSLELDRPGVYFGEELSDFVIVDTKTREIDFQDDDGTQFTSYEGRDGVGVGSLLRRAAFFLRFGDQNTLISGNIQGSSKILIKRDVRDRVETLAPFLSFDADPYPVVLDGKLLWVIDGYTTTSRYPNAQRADVSDLPVNSGLDHNFNYARNSVKAVVDAYDGTTTFYVVDEEDPIVDAYRSAFPELFTDRDEIPAGLDEHFRYPEDLFRVQTNMWGRYHLDDPDDFYNQNDAWNVAGEPDAREAAVTTSTSSAGGGTQVAVPRGRRMEPYYLLMRLPGETEEDFLLLRPFVPTSGDDGQRLLTGFMVAKSDPDSYGELEVFVMPRSNLPDGPAIAASLMQSNKEVAELQTLLGQSGSELTYGNLILTPIEQSLLYVRPVYVQSDAQKIPSLTKVIGYFNNRVVVKDTLAETLTELFGPAPGAGPPAPPTGGGTTPPPTGGGTTPPPSTDVAALLVEAARAFDEAEAARTRGDLGEYQAKVTTGKALVDRANAAAGGAGATTTTTTAAPRSTT